MIKEELIRYGKDYLHVLETACCPVSDIHKEFVREAIKALEQQKPMEKFENAKDHIRKLAGDYKCYDNRLTDEEALELCHILEQQPSDDCVSREAVLDLMQLKMGGKELYKAVYDLPPVTPTFLKGESNGDMIKAMFPSLKIRWVSQSHIGVTFRDNQDYITELELDWWNAPYKRGSENG